MNPVAPIRLTGIGYVGSVGRAGAGLCARRDPGANEHNALRWYAAGEHCELALRYSGLKLLPVSEKGTVLVCGYAVRSGSDRVCLHEELAELVWKGYERLGRPPVEELEGCYTAVILDKLRGRVQAYRNLCSNHTLYYTEWNGCLWFGSNAAVVVRACPRPPVPNQSVLPAFFLFRSVPGRETLFRGVNRLMPGELLSYGEDGLSLRRLQTFADFEEPGPTTAEVVDRFEETMARVMRNIAEIDPQAANLLSGGVDSSLLQVYWNRAIGGGSVQPASVEVVVAHPRTETDHKYARSAAELLGTSHHTVSAGDSYAENLKGQISATGEPPNHVQTAYVGRLAQSMKSLGFSAGICGEGADSLFGTDWSGVLARALRFERVPGLWILRGAIAGLAALVGKPGWRDAFQLIGKTCHYADASHPINRVAVFADVPLVAVSFAPERVARAFAWRRALVNGLSSNDVCRLVDMTGFVSEALLTAALWTGLCEPAGVRLYCPYLDSRIVRIAVNLNGDFRYRDGQSKWVLKTALARHLPKPMVYRPKRGFGQPIFEWLAEGGQLRRRAEQIADYDFVPRRVRERALARPSWFLYSLLCYDIWHKTFIDNES